MKKEIFIFIVGTTPQIATETLYALHNKKPSIHPDEINIITTITGKDIIEKKLIKSGSLIRFYKEFGIKPVLPSIFVITDKSGKPLDDIKTQQDNEDVGDFITEFVKGKTKLADTRLHCSIAGGRKTMSFYLGAALSLFGRPQDKLYHVLVTPELESHPDFYWKPKKDKNIIVKDREGKTIKIINTKDANIILAELPYIHMRDKFSIDARSFRELVVEGQKEIDTASVQMPLKVSLKERTIKIGSISVGMTPVQLAIYIEFIKQKLEKCIHHRKPYCLNCADCFCLIKGGDFSIEKMADSYKKIYGQKIYKDEDFRERWKDIDIDNNLRQNISKINRKIKEHLNNDILASFYTIIPVGKYGAKKYGIKVEKKKIEIE